MAKTLYIIDLDGTLLNRQSRLSKFTIDNLNHLLNKGVLFTFATARSWHSAHVVTEGLCSSLPWIVHNGAFTVDGTTGKPSHQVFFRKEESEFILQLADELGLWPLVYAIINGREQVLYCPNAHMHAGTKYYISSRQGDPRLLAVDNHKDLHQDNIYYFTFIDSHKPLLPLWKRIEGVSWLNCTFQQELYRQEYWLEITPGPATKAHAALRLKNELQCQRIVAFGDAMNDLPLFAAADESYAVTNALPQVKAAATGIIGSCQDDGVVKFLMSLGDRL